MKQWYEELFENYAENYDKECYVQGTVGEADFIEKQINHDKSLRILDIGCGTGRHAIELAKRGYTVTGVDLSEAQLKMARQKAEDAGVEVEFIQKDARRLDFTNEFDLVIMICEGGFSLMETDQMNFEILRGAAKALKEGGRFIFTALNALFMLWQAQNRPSNETLSSGSFDLMTFRQSSVLKTKDDSGKDMELKCNERYYCPSEITWQLKSLGFGDIGIFGCKLGAFSRDDKLTKDDFEMLVVAQK